MTRSLVRPLTRSLTRSLVRGPSLDPDAAAYIAALVSGGATVSSVQSSAIDTFIRAEKSGGRWDLIKRMYLPIWGLAAPNAICMRSLTSGTFVGGVTHGAGFVQGDGSTGYFDPGASGNLRTLGMSGGNNMMGILHYDSSGATVAMMSATDTTVSAANRFQFNTAGSTTSAGSGAQFQFASPSNRSGVVLVHDDLIRNGLFIGSVTATNARHLHRRTSSTIDTVSNSKTEAEDIADLQPFIMARNNTGSPDLFSPSKIRMAIYGLATTTAQTESLAANLATLDNLLTELTLP